MVFWLFKPGKLWTLIVTCDDDLELFLFYNQIFKTDAIPTSKPNLQLELATPIFIWLAKNYSFNYSFKLQSKNYLAVLGN